jgi:hypothetical protein
MKKNRTTHKFIKKGNGNNRSLFFGYNAVNLTCIFLFFSSFTLFSSPKNTDGTRFAYPVNVSSASTEQDTTPTKSGFVLDYLEDNDTYVVEIFVKTGQSISSLAIYNMLGKEVERVRLSSRTVKSENSEGRTYVYRINISLFTPAMYIVALEGTDFKDVVRFVKSR